MMSVTWNNRMPFKVTGVDYMCVPLLQGHTLQRYVILEA